ncbi:hypothetical protein OCB69_27000 [Bacillus cereus]|nr:hypothetical protein [Bacillus cereus]
MKTYMSPTIIEFGKAVDTIQGCGGWGSEGWTLDDSDRQYRLVTNKDGSKKHCICTTMRSETCEP